MTYPTQAAHTLLRHAHARGTQAALARSFFEAYFMNGLNIADETLLASIAAAHGFTLGEALELVRCEAELELTREEAQSAVEAGIRGVPFFVFDGRVGVSGAQPVGVLQAALRRAVEPSPAPSVLPAPIH
jgi:predicted DsbA family dithiol-disulfide isomerase